VVAQVAIFAVDRYEVFGTQELVHGAQFTLASVARGVNGLVARMNNFGTGSVQIVNDATNRPFIARDGVGTQNNGVVRTYREIASVTARKF
jgi:hypothetical protein